MRLILLLALTSIAISITLLSEDSSGKILRDIYGSDKIAQPWTLPQQKGDAATGVVMSEAQDKLYLDTDPCNSKVETFSKPYEKTPTGKSTKCKGHEIDLFFVRQK
jgi:hypothetical protein